MTYFQAWAIQREQVRKQFPIFYSKGGEKNTTITKVLTGRYLKGSFVKENDIKEFVIVSKPEIVDSEYEGKITKKVQCQVEYKDKGKEDPNVWEMNQTCRNILVDKFGEDETNWMGKKIPVETGLTSNNKRSIMVDSTILAKLD